MRRGTLPSVLIALVLLVLDCQGSEQTNERMTAPVAPVLVPRNGEPALPDNIEGSVVQTLSAGRYIYIELNTGTGSVWVAAVEESVAKGDRILCKPEMLMERFESHILKRTFDRLYFVGPLTNPRNTAVMPTNHPSIQEMHVGREQASLPDGADINVNLPRAKGGVTIAELTADKEKLVGTEVLLRGRVTKYNADIMGANWLHVRDASNKRYLVVTTKIEVKVGDTVLIRGRLERDVDLGHGYSYDLLIRNADVTMEK